MTKKIKLRNKGEGTTQIEKDVYILVLRGCQENYQNTVL